MSGKKEEKLRPVTKPLHDLTWPSAESCEPQNFKHGLKKAIEGHTKAVQLS